MPAAEEHHLVALRLPPGEAFVEQLERAWSRGDAVSPLEPRWPEPVVEKLLDELRPSLLIEPGGERKVENGLPVEPGVALIVPTSGTTGAPKGVELTHDNLRASSEAVTKRLGLGREDRWLCCLPLTHIAGLSILVRSKLIESTPIIHPRFDPGEVQREAPATIISVVPTMLARLLDSDVDIARFRWVLVGGGPAAPSLLERAREAGGRVVVTYGMTETCGGIVYDGVPLDEVEVELARSQEIKIRGPMIMRGYRRRPELTAAALRDGWFHTSDLGELRPDGRLEILGRNDEIIITGGEKVAPGEVASVLMEHPAVRDVMVFGKEDSKWGQRVVALIVPVPGQAPAPEDLQAFVRQTTAPHKVPRELEFVEELPARRSAGTNFPY